MKRTGGPTDFKKIFMQIYWSKMHQIGQPMTVLKSLESEDFKTVIGCPIRCIFDQDMCIKIFLKSVGPPVRFIFSLYIFWKGCPSKVFSLNFTLDKNVCNKCP